MKRLHLPGGTLSWVALPRAIQPALTALAFTPAAALAADQTHGSDGTALNLFKLVLGLVVVLAMMGASAWALKRFGVAKAAGDRTIKVIGGVSVGTRERVLVVEVADQWIVVGVAPGRVSSLATLPKQENVPQPPEATAPTGNFAVWLKQAMGKRHAE